MKSCESWVLYRGYGKSEGRPGQDALFSDALFIFDYILAFSDRLLIGYYLGSEMVGIYGANYDLIKQLSLFFMIVQGYIMYPRINKAYSDKKQNIFNDLFNYNIK